MAACPAEVGKVGLVQEIQLEVRQEILQAGKVAYLVEGRASRSGGTMAYLVRQLSIVSLVKSLQFRRIGPYGLEAHPGTRQEEDLASRVAFGTLLVVQMA